VFDGADQDKFTDVGEIGVAIRPVGDAGSVPVEEDVGVADTSLDVILVPTEFIAEIL
jgi:hypothetical protein